MLLTAVTNAIRPVAAVPQRVQSTATTPSQISTKIFGSKEIGAKIELPIIYTKNLFQFSITYRGEEPVEKAFEAYLARAKSLSPKGGLILQPLK